MIITKFNKGYVKNPSEYLKNVDGIYYGIISHVSVAYNLGQNTIYRCRLYIPEIYGKFSLNVNSLPFVEVPKHQDADDIRGHVPEVGDLCKVAFDNGNINSTSCRFIHQIILPDYIRDSNALYIKSGVISMNLSKSKNYAKYESYIPLLYLLILGKDEDKLDASDFILKVLGSSTMVDDNEYPPRSVSAARNYFCKALNMPFTSYFSMINSEQYKDYPILGSPYYNIKNVIQDIYDNPDNMSAMKKLWTDPKYDIDLEIENIPIDSFYDIYQSLKNDKNYANKDIDTIMYNIAVSCLVMNDPQYISVMNLDTNYAEDCKKIMGENLSIGSVNDYTMSQNFSTIRNYAECAWENDTYSKFFSEILYNNKDSFDKEWLQSVQGISDGISQFTTNKDVQNTVLFCLTACPFLTYPMFGGYDAENFTLDDDQNRPYETFMSQEQYEEVSGRLQDLTTNSTTPEDFVTGFKEIAKDVFEDGVVLDFNESSGKTINTWKESGMEDAFDRIYNNIDKIKELD